MDRQARQQPDVINIEHPDAISIEDPDVIDVEHPDVISLERADIEHSNAINVELRDLHPDSRPPAVVAAAPPRPPAPPLAAHPPGLAPVWQPAAVASRAPVPPEVAAMGWCWGAFGLSWIWGIGNKVWIALLWLALAAIPYVGLPASVAFEVWLGINGHRLAWQSRPFSSRLQYVQTMRVWNAWGLWLFVARAVLVVLGTIAWVVLLRSGMFQSYLLQLQ